MPSGNTAAHRQGTHVPAHTMLMILARRLRHWLLVALALLTASAAWAREDDGAWQILHARYGTAERNIDVTGRLKELARSDRRFKLTNELFRQDPAVGQRKTLRIFAKGRNGEVRNFDYREGDWVDGANFTGWGGGNWGDNTWNGGWDGPRPGQAGNRDDDGNWAILQARYGTPDRNIDVTGRLKELARSDRRFKLTNQLFREDPAVGQRKTLRIIAKGRRGEIRNFDYREGDWVDGSDFTGWGRGNWGDNNWNGGWNGRPGVGLQPPPPPPADARVLIINRATYGAGNRQADVTARLRNISRGGSVDIPVDNNLVDRDPAVGDRKTLRVYYQIGRGPERVAEAREGERLRINP